MPADAGAAMPARMAAMDFDRVDDSRGEPPAEWPEHFEGRARLQPFPNPFPPGGASVAAVHFETGGRSRVDEGDWAS
jgi:hypothetical protein